MSVAVVAVANGNIDGTGAGDEVYPATSFVISTGAYAPASHGSCWHGNSSVADKAPWHPGLAMPAGVGGGLLHSGLDVELYTDFLF